MNMESIVETTYNEDTDSHEIRVRGKLIFNLSEEDLNILESEKGDASCFLNDFMLDLSLRDGV